MGNAGPLSRYRDLIDTGEFRPDPAQLDAVTNLQRLFEELMQTPKPKGWFSRILADDSVRPVKGLYFWGGVGRGKTFLMDIFFESLPFKEKQRMHFHRFMRYVHQQLRRLQGEPNPLVKLASEFAAKTRVLCFDEFFVSDITDAMILAGLLEVLFDRGVTLVATSNVEPARLYQDGLQRRKFLPAIALLQAHTYILNVDGGVDYRLRALETAEIYHYPLDGQGEKSLQQSFDAISPDVRKIDTQLEIEGRIIQARRCGDGVVWFDFQEICDGPRSQNDYIELAMMFHTVLISGVPQFTFRTENAARRFISLVDEFYDHNVKLILTAEVSILELYQGEKLGFEFERTMSRLQEMQSREYLANEHLP